MVLPNIPNNPENPRKFVISITPEGVHGSYLTMYLPPSHNWFSQMVPGSCLAEKDDPVSVHQLDNGEDYFSIVNKCDIDICPLASTGCTKNFRVIPRD